MLKKIYYATGNTGKFEEVQSFFKKVLPECALLQCDKDFFEIQTSDQEVIAVDKARQAWEYLKEPVLVDDAGIFFEKYNNFPGVFTKFIYEGIGLDGLLKLVEPGDRATFKLTLVYYYNDRLFKPFEASVSGTIVHQNEYVAHAKLPYDALFAPDGADGRTFAQLRYTDELEKYNYRVQALHKFLEWYQEEQRADV